MPWMGSAVVGVVEGDRMWVNPRLYRSLPARCRECGWHGTPLGLDLESWPEIGPGTLTGRVIGRFRCPGCDAWVQVQVDE